MLLVLFLSYILALYMLKCRSSNSRLSLFLDSAKQGWVCVVQWRPLGLKFAALLGLAVFWFDKEVTSSC